MKQIFHIGLIDLKIMVKDKIFFFWTLIFPLVFILIFGNLTNNNTQQSKAELMIINKDKGEWGDYFIKKMTSPDIVINSIDKEPESFNRILFIPENFSKKMETGTPQSLIMKLDSGASVKAAAQIEVKITQGITKLITEIAINSGVKDFFDKKIKFSEIIKTKLIDINKGAEIVPSGFDHVIPGVLVQFIMMMVLIYGGVVVMMDRQKGRLVRILYSATTIRELWGGKFLGRLMMGLLQAFILVFVGMIFFGLNFGNNLSAFLIILFFSMVISSLSILIGSLIKKEDLIVGLSVLSANTFAALGGCWWPIEVVPQTVKTIGMISPAYWAMDGFHKIIFFNKGLSDISINLLVLAIYTTIFSILSIKFFKIKE